MIALSGQLGNRAQVARVTVTPRVADGTRQWRSEVNRNNERYREGRRKNNERNREGIRGNKKEKWGRIGRS